jgi:pre-mRNA-splicing factor RBM22/SLT11
MSQNQGAPKYRLSSCFKAKAHFRCAFVNFKDRDSAERAAEAWANGLDMDDERVLVKWGRSKGSAKSAAPTVGPSAVPAPA